MRRTESYMKTAKTAAADIRSGDKIFDYKRRQSS